MKAVKRDGREVTLDRGKIKNAIIKAYSEVYNSEIDYFIDEINTVADKVMLDIKNNKTTVEDIQDFVLKELKNINEAVYEAYKEYRERRDIQRKSKVYNSYLSISNVEKNDITRDNGNMNADTPSGQMMKYASEATKPFAIDVLLSKQAKKAFLDNWIYIHDNDYYPTKSLTCLQHPVDKLFNKGFKAGHGSSRPVKRIETSSIISCISLEQIQNEMHGGQSIPAFDFYNAPSVRKTYIEEIKEIEKYENKNLEHLYDYKIDDYITKDISNLEGDNKIVQHAINRTVFRVHQGMEAFIHNSNEIHSRGGNQVVFSSINYGSDTSPEGRCIIREILLSTYRGVGNGETPIFPIQIWKKKRGINYLPEDKNYDLYKLACKVSAKRFFPNFLNLDATFNKSELWNENDENRYIHEPATMGCRTRVFENLHGIKQSVSRGNLSFSTLNIVKMSIESKLKFPDDEVKRIKHFYKLLDKYIDIIAEQLYDRYKFQCTALKKQFPLLMSGMWLDSEKLKNDDMVADVLKHGTLGIGFVGLAECLIGLTGKHHGECSKSQELGLDILKHLNKRVDEYKDKYNLNYSVLATPAESMAHKSCKKDRDTYGIIEGITDKIYYTNSSHVPVWYKCTVEEKARIEAPYHILSKGGHIFYTEIDGDAVHNPLAIEKVVDLMDKYNMGYGSVNHTRARCLNCGFENSDKKMTYCPKCNSTSIDIIQRITGYLIGSLDKWNDGKLAELEDRVVHG